MSSIQEVQAVLDTIRELLAEMYRSASSAGERLDEAIEILTETSRTHHESLVPAGFAMVSERMPDFLGQISASMQSVETLAARL